MTDAAFLVGWNMRGTFTDSDSIVMATTTRTLNLAVIDNNYRFPSARALMASFAFSAAFYMGGTFASCLNAVMTGIARATNATVVKSTIGDAPSGAFRVMAGIARCTGWNMI